ncbi:MAG: hypothetical protein ACR2LN_07920 [Candidatus Levyibacteriota bacterium]
MLYIFIIGGVVLSLIFDFRGVQNTQWYLLLTATLLAIGLYSSTFGISISEARRNLRLILTAVTVGVFAKALIIGCVMAFILKNPFGFILGIIVAQIDPLSTVALLDSSRLSKRAKTILAAWSSFDDPVTVIMSLYFPALIASLVGAHWQPIEGTMQSVGLSGYFAETGINIVFATGVFALWMFIKHYAKATRYLIIIFAAVAMYLLVVGSLSIAVYYFWMLGVAILGLFMRPPLGKIIHHAVHWAMYMAAILLGILLINGINILGGIALGIAAFGAQILVGYLLTHKLPSHDRLRIAFSQQNGITAIILALLFEPYYSGTIAIIAPAIIVINTLHAAMNIVLNAHLENDWSYFSWSVQREKIKIHMKKI